MRAQKFAEHLASLGKLKHGEDKLSGKHRVGENLYGGMGDSHSYTVASVDAWYSEVEEYRRHEGDNNRNTSAGHFTQVRLIYLESK